METRNLTDAESLLRKMLAIHALDYDADVTSEAYPGEHHEEAEEAWCREAAAYLSLPAPSVRLRLVVESAVGALGNPKGLHQYDKGYHRSDCAACEYLALFKDALAAEAVS